MVYQTVLGEARGGSARLRTVSGSGFPFDKSPRGGLNFGPRNKCSDSSLIGASCPVCFSLSIHSFIHSAHTHHSRHKGYSRTLNKTAAIPGTPSAGSAVPPGEAPGASREDSLILTLRGGRKAGCTWSGLTCFLSSQRPPLCSNSSAVTGPLLPTCWGAMASGQVARVEQGVPTGQADGHPPHLLVTRHPSSSE